MYTVNDVIKGTEFIPQQLIGVGGGAPGLIRALGEAMALPVDIPAGAMVANAIGAAVARPTLSAGLRADTTDGYYIIPEGGKRESLPRRFNKQAAEELLASWLREQTGAVAAARPGNGAYQLRAFSYSTRLLRNRRYL